MKKHPCLSIFSKTVIAFTLLFTTMTSFATNHPPYNVLFPGYRGMIGKPENNPYIITRPCYKRPCRFLRDGIYVGIMGGYDSFGYRQSVNLEDVDFIFDSANPVIHNRGAMGGLYAGYGQIFEWFYIAGEIFTKYSGTRSSFALGAYNSDFTVRETYGVSLLPGVMLNPAVLAYARLGYSRTFFKADEDGVLALGGHIRTSNFGNGMDFGLGMEFELVGNFSARAEYVYTTYSKFVTEFNTRYAPSNNEATLSLSYRFC